MDANKPIHEQVKALRDTWRELWWKMAGGVKSEYDKLKGTDVQEFWKLFDLWNDQVQREREIYKQKNSENARRK